MEVEEGKQTNPKPAEEKKRKKKALSTWLSLKKKRPSS